MLISTIVAALALVAHDPPMRRCSIGELRNNPEGYFWPLSNIRSFIGDAELIVRARAVGVGPAQPLQMLGRPDASIQFNVLEVLRGDRSATQLFVPGDSTSLDDFNGTAVPYRMVRAGGQHGNCFATAYKIGAEYLLLLRRKNGVFNPYWAPLAPLNEQVTGRDDPWVDWVRQQIS